MSKYLYQLNNSDQIIAVGIKVDDSTIKDAIVSKLDNYFISTENIIDRTGFFQVFDKYNNLLYKANKTSNTIEDILPLKLDLQKFIINLLNTQFIFNLESQTFTDLYGGEQKAKTKFITWITDGSPNPDNKDIDKNYYETWLGGRDAQYAKLTTEKTWINDSDRTVTELILYRDKEDYITNMVVT